MIDIVVKLHAAIAETCDGSDFDVLDRGDAKIAADEIERLRAELASRYSAGFADAREAAKRLADTFDCYTGHGREYTHEDEHTRIYACGNKNAANTLSIMIGALKEELTR